MPGRYDIGTQRILLWPFVDIEGSGEGTTKIVAYEDIPIQMWQAGAAIRSLTLEHFVPSAYGGYNAILVEGPGPGLARLSSLTIKSVGTAPGAQGLALSSANAVLHDVTVMMDGGGTSGNLTAISIGNNNISSTAVELDNVRVQIANVAGGVGLYVPGTTLLSHVNFQNGSIDITCNDGTGCYGLWGSPGVTIRNSTLSSSGCGARAGGTTIVGSQVAGEVYSLVADGASRVSFSELRGAINAAFGTGMACFGVHDESFATVTCP